MKIGLIADVHADLEALERAWGLLERLGASEVLCAGDLVDLGRHADAALTYMRIRGIPTVCGNHDRKLFTRKPKKFKKRHTKPKRIAPSNLAYLRALPNSLSRQYGRLRLKVYHAVPEDDMARVHPRFYDAGQVAALLEQIQADVLVVGHTHLPVCVETSAGVVINPGSLFVESRVRRPRSSRTFGLLDTGTLAYRLFDVKTGAEHERRTWPWWKDVK